MIINSINARATDLAEREILTKLALVLVRASFEISVSSPHQNGPDLVVRSPDGAGEFAIELKTYGSLADLQHAVNHEKNGAGKTPLDVHMIGAVRGDDAIYTDSALVEKLSPYLYGIKLQAISSPWAKDQARP